MENAKKKTALYWGKIVIWLAVIAIIWNLPASGALTTVGVHNLAAFVGLILGMILVDFVIPSLTSILLIAYSGAYNSIGEVMTAGLGGNTFVMIFSILLVGGIISYSGLAEQVAVKMLNSRIATGKPWTLTFLVLFVTWLLSVFLTPMVPIVIVTSVVLSMFQSMNIEKGNKWAQMLLFGIAVVAITAQNIMPFQSGPALTGVFAGSIDSRLSLNAALPTFMLVSFIVSVLFFAFVFLLIYLVGRKSIDKVYQYKAEAGSTALTKDAKTGLIMLAFYVLIQFIPVFLPADSAIRAKLAFLEIPGAGFLTCLIALLIMRKDGSHFINIKQITDNGLEWNILMMLVAIGACSAPMTSEVTGIVPWLTDLVAPMVEGVNPFGVFVILCIIAIIGTNLSDNLAICVVLVPLMITIALASGMNGLSMVVWSLHTIQLGILLPAATPHIAIIFGKEDTGYVKRGTMIKWAAVVLVFEIIVVMTFGWASYHWFPNVFA